MVDWRDGAEVTPHPEGDLEATVTCSTARGRSRGARHPLTLHADWTFTTPHDLEAERVAAAFGGYLSCLELEAHVVPAVRALVRRALRADVPEIKRSADDRWLLDRPVAGCCARPLAWRTAASAAQHLRKPEHLAAEFGVASHRIVPLAAQVLSAHGVVLGSVPEAVDATAGVLVPSRSAARELWEAGFSAARLAVMHDAVAAEGPLPVAYYYAVLSRQPDLAWVRGTARAVPDRADETWLASTETCADREDPLLRRTWLALGLARSDIATLSGSPYDPDDVRDLATRVHLTPTAAGATLASWVLAGATPDVVSLARVLRESPSGQLQVSRDAVDAVLTALPGSSRTEAALVLVLCGSPAVALRVAPHASSLEPADVLEALDHWNDDQQRRSATHA